MSEETRIASIRSDEVEDLSKEIFSAIQKLMPNKINENDIFKIMAALAAVNHMFEGALKNMGIDFKRIEIVTKNDDTIQ